MIREMITVFTRPSCAPCRTLKYWLQKKGVEYQEIPAGDRVAVAPTIVIGEEVIVGLNFRRITELLAL